MKLDVELSVEDADELAKSIAHSKRLTKLVYGTNKGKVPIQAQLIILRDEIDALRKELEYFREAQLTLNKEILKIS